MGTDKIQFNSDATHLTPATQKQLVRAVTEFANAYADSAHQCLTYIDKHPRKPNRPDEAGEVLAYTYHIANGIHSNDPLPAALKDLPDTKALITAAHREYNARQGVNTALAAAGITDKHLNPTKAIEAELGQSPYRPLDLNRIQVGEIILIPFSDLIHDHSFPIINTHATSTASSAPKPVVPPAPHSAPTAAAPTPHTPVAPLKPVSAPTQGKTVLAAGERAQIAADKLNLNESIDYLDAHHIKHAHLHKLLPPVGHDHNGAEKKAMHGMMKVTHGVALWRWMENHDLHVHTAGEFVETPRTPAAPPAPHPKGKGQ